MKEDVSIKIRYHLSAKNVNIRKKRPTRGLFDSFQIMFEKCPQNGLQ